MAMKYLTYAAIPLMAASLSTQAATVDQLNKQVQKLNQRIAAADQRFRVNGFASFGLVQSSEPESYHRGITDDVNFRRYTKAGIQMTFNLDSDTSVITQLVSKGENDFETKAEWMYLKHNLGNGFTAKMGRLRKPNYLLSEYFDVGYAMPWTQAPVEVYGVLELSANYEAVDLSYDFDLTDDWSATAQVQYGRAVGADTISNDLVALNYSMTNGELTLRAGYSRADVSIVSGGSIESVAALINPTILASDKPENAATGSLEGTFAGLAAMYDNGTILAIAEFTSLSVDSVFADQDGYYAMGGYRMGQWMPYITYSSEETTDDSDRSLTAVPSGSLTALNVGTAQAILASLNSEQTRTGLGVRYDLKPGVAVKFQYDMADAGDTGGEFDNGANGLPAPPSDGKANIMSFTIDTVF